MITRADKGGLSGSSDDQYSPEETAQRRDAVLKILVNTPPQPHATHRPVRQRRRKTTGEDLPPRKASVHQRTS
jgi:hypothetical protein